MTRSSFLLLAVVCFMGASCVKDDKIEPEIKSETKAPVLTFKFNARVKEEPLTVNTGTYTNWSMDSFTVTKFNYYISNLKLTREDGFVFTEPESYHLIRHVEGQTSFSLTNIPEGNYKKIEFMIGVDSLRNVSGAQLGALDVSNDMFWDWNQGYIFFKMEGAFNTLTVPQWGDYAIHIGGFKGKYSCLQKCSFDLTSAIAAKNGGSSRVSYNVQVDEVFISPSVMGFDDYYSSIGERTFKAMSDNYSDMFVVEKIEN